MRTPAIILFALVMVAPASAQQILHLQPNGPAQPGTPVPPPVSDLQTFTTDAVELRLVDRHWRLQAGAVCLKDFGDNQRDAATALRLVRTLNLTQHGTIGTLSPVIEYWLSYGKAPVGLHADFPTTRIKLESLRVELINGLWCVRDDDRLWFNFGAVASDARAAVALLRSYGMNEVGFLGRPPKSMMVFVAGPDRDDRPAPVRLNPDKKSTGDARAGIMEMMGVRQLAAGPVSGEVGVENRFDWRRLEVQREATGWRLVSAGTVLAEFGADERAARLACTLVQQYRCTERRALGKPASFSYYLADGTAPRGQSLSAGFRSFRPESLSLQQQGTNWAIVDGEQVLVSFGGCPEEAKLALDLIKHHEFDGYVRLGAGTAADLMFWVKKH